MSNHKRRRLKYRGSDLQDFVEFVRPSISCFVSDVDFRLSVFKNIQWQSAFHQFLGEHTMIRDVRIYRTALLCLLCLHEFNIKGRKSLFVDTVERVIDFLDRDEKFSVNVPDVLFALGY